MMTAFLPSTSPATSSPAWPGTVDTGKWGMSPYGMTVGFSSVSAITPRPDPRMSPTSGSKGSFAFRAAAASFTWFNISVLPLPSCKQFVQETAPVPVVTDAEIGRHRRRQIGEGVPHADRPAAFHGRAPGEDGHVFPGMVRAVVDRIVAVVGGDNQEIPFGKARHDVRHEPVKKRQRLRIALRIPAMAVQRIEIDEIDQKEA